MNIIKNINSNKNKNNKVSILTLISIALFFNPIFSSANFYNSWVDNIIFAIFSYLIIFNSKKINLINYLLNKIFPKLIIIIKN